VNPAVVPRPFVQTALPVMFTILIVAWINAKAFGGMTRRFDGLLIRTFRGSVLIVMPGGRNYRCTDCRGSGRCEQCYGSGANLHLNEPDPTCASCHGMRICQTCEGNRVLPKSSDFGDAPLGLRLFFSAIPAFMLYKVLIAQEPVHFGRGGPIMPKPAGWLSFIGVCGPFLYVVWKGTRLSDFHFKKERRISLFGESDAPPGPRRPSDTPLL
jgi:hypothetical protein